MLLLTQCSEVKVTGNAPAQTSKNAASNNLSKHNALPKFAKSPSSNLTSPSKIKLGKLLFFDPILSGDKDISCATCHHPTQGYAEYKDLSIGTNGVGLGSKRIFKSNNKIPLMKRNAHTILNTGFNGMNTQTSYAPVDAPMFWDSRVVSLEKQALEPILTLEEMGGFNFEKSEILTEVVNRLSRIPEYVDLFSNAFKEQDPINEDNIGKAIASFERTLITTETRFDRYMRGEKDAISISEREGFLLFNKVGCGKCHNGPMFSDFLPHVIGVPHNPKLDEYDKGINDEYAFRTASLRNLRFTAPYMHNGKFNSLKEVLEFYEDVKGRSNRHEDINTEQLDPLIRELDLSTQDIGPIISFLNTLNDSNFDREIPESVPSGLEVGGNIK